MIEVAAGIFIVAVVVAQALVVTRLRGPAPRHSVRPAVGAGAAASSAVPATDPMGRLVEVLRRRRWLRRSLSLASVAIMCVAVGMIGYPFYTNLYASRIQARLDRQFTSEALRNDYLNCRALDRNDPACQIQDGDSLTRIQIPSIDVDVVVVEGTTPDALRAGAGHYRSTPLPCEVGNVSIAGHRTTYGRPFNNVDLLEVGSEITLVTPIGSCTYHVVSQHITVPSDGTVIANTPDRSMLTLTTCHPKGSARQRLIVQAELVTPLPTDG